ncbi:MAG: LysM peptidoglycan-binding domain-containing protein [Firmicutes bacterium]|nr:LysM peptidoglycan-binding domain-containing protein [Bacillota bacterium]
MNLHVVRAGASIWSIASQYGVTPNAIQSLNQLPSSRIVPGQTLLIPTKARSYAVMPGDTLSTIASSYGLSLSALLAANPQIKGTAIAYGDMIKLPAVSRPDKVALGFLELTQPEADRMHVSTNAPYYTYLSLFGYGMNTAGSIIPAKDKPALQAMSQTRAMPAATFSNWTGTDFSPDVVHTVLSNASLRGQYITEMLSIVQSKSYRAVVIDFESLHAADRESFVQFLDQLSDKLQPLHIALIVCLMPITGHLDYEGPIVQAYDYDGIARHATYIMLMSYNWAWPGGPPGPIAPLSLVEDNIRYALQQMSSQQILLGLIRYGYDWALPYQAGEATKTWGVQAVVEKAMYEQIAIHFDKPSATPYLHYWDGNGKQHVIWFEDARSLQFKFQLVQKYQLAGIAAWELSERFAQFNPLMTDQFQIQ